MDSNESRDSNESQDLRERRLVGEATSIIGEEGQGEFSSAPHQVDKDARFFRGVMAAICIGDEGLGEVSN